MNLAGTRSSARTPAGFVHPSVPGHRGTGHRTARPAGRPAGERAGAGPHQPGSGAPVPSTGTECGYPADQDSCTVTSFGTLRPGLEPRRVATAALSRRPLSYPARSPASPGRSVTLPQRARRSRRRDPLVMAACLSPACARSHASPAVDPGESESTAVTGPPPPEAPLPAQASFAPSGTTPVVAYRQSATSSLRARATRST